MSTAGPTKPWYSRDLFEWLGWRSSEPETISPNPKPRNPLGRWEGLIMANTAARREAKGVLFAELAEAVRQGMPLELALAHASQSTEEAAQTRKRGSNMAPGAQSRYRALEVITAAIMVFLADMPSFIYAIFAFRMVDVDRISRLLALRLQRLVASGHSLSEAMRRCEEDYDDSEVQMIEASERWGKLDEGLRRLSQFQISEKRLTMMGTLALYPLWVGTVLGSIASFILIFILPKFHDIYDQLGAELPLPTQTIMNFAYGMTHGAIGLLLDMLLIVALLFFLIRGMMNGRRLTKILFGIFVIVTLANIVALVGASLQVSMKFFGNNQNLGELPTLGLALGGILLLVLIALAVPYLLDGLETNVLRIERISRPLIRYIPFVGRVVWVEEQARWLGALALGLSSGIRPAQAVQSAGIICAGPLLRRSQRAAALIESGHPIGRACVKAGVLESTANHRLALLDGRPDYLEGLRSVADDAAQNAFEWLNRSGRAVEILMIIGLGIVVGMFAISMYLPLFNIPKIVGHY